MPEQQPGLFPDIEFEQIIRSADIGMAKPDTEIFRYAQDKAGVGAEEILFIDDSEKNVSSAKLLGWHAILCNKLNPEETVQQVYQLCSL